MTLDLLSNENSFLLVVLGDFNGKQVNSMTKIVALLKEFKL